MEQHHPRYGTDRGQFRQGAKAGLDRRRLDHADRARRNRLTEQLGGRRGVPHGPDAPVPAGHLPGDHLDPRRQGAPRVGLGKGADQAAVDARCRIAVVAGVQPAPAEGRHDRARPPDQGDGRGGRRGHPELGRVAGPADVRGPLGLAHEERIRGVDPVPALHRPHHVVTVPGRGAPATVQVPEERTADRVRVGPLAVRAPYDPGADRAGPGHVLAAEHELVPIVRNGGQKPLDLLAEPGPEAGIVFEHQERIHPVRNGPLEDLPVALHAPPRPAPGSPALWDRNRGPVDRLEHDRLGERPVTRGDLGPERAQSVRAAAQVDDDDSIEHGPLTSYCPSRARSACAGRPD